MTAAEILTKVAARGFRVTLNSTGDGLILWPGDKPPADLVELLKAHKPDIVAHLQAERGRINHWIAEKIISWPQTHCLHCRKPITAQPWIDVASGEGMARFHQDCHVAWLEQQEVAARRAMGLDRSQREWSS
jgi:hypothetical protein